MWMGSLSALTFGHGSHRGNRGFSPGEGHNRAEVSVLLLFLPLTPQMHAPAFPIGETCLKFHALEQY